MRVAITGVSSGIGAATAARMKADGAEIVGFDIAEPKYNVDQWIRADMSDPNSIASAAAAVNGNFSALLNIAGLPPREGMTAKVLQVNYFGLIAFTEAVLSKLEEKASIVNLASRAGAQWRENVDQVKALMAIDRPDEERLTEFATAQNVDHVRSYNLSKEAVIVWTMAQTERMVSMGLRMNSVSPAAVETGILVDFKNAFGERVDQSIARAQRAGNPGEVAELVAFLAKPESNWIKGADISIDGGITAMVNSDVLELNS